MGLPLTGSSVASSYSGLLKTTDNGVLGATEKVMSDGLGNDSTLSLGTTSASFTGTLDLSGATVTGLPGGAPGLVAGSAANSMRSADALTPVDPATATNTFAISLGYGSNATGTKTVSIGALAEATGINALALGHDSHATNTNATALGIGVYAQASGALAIGNLTRSESSAVNGIAIGTSAFSRANSAIVIGASAVVDDAIRVDTVVIGRSAKSAQYSVSIGASAFGIGDDCVSIGNNSRAAGSNASALGSGAQADYNFTTAIGAGVAALNWTNSVTMQQLALISTGNYADDAAAAAAGVPVNGVYHTSGTLKIRLV